MLQLNRERRSSSGINAGSMADIAFLLLIFFLVTTAIVEDKGIMVRLPPWSDQAEPPKLPPHNLWVVAINANNELFVRDETLSIDELRAKTQEFILNPNQRPDLASAPNKALISFRHDRGTEYETYLMVYNELKASYHGIWDEMAQSRYGRNYDDLASWAKRAIQKEVPMVISESEPSDWANAF